MSKGKHSKGAHIFRSSAMYPSRAIISRSAFEHNLARAKDLAGDAQIMAVVKADAYGHGAVQIAQWAIESGVNWLVIAQLGEAIAVRRKLREIMLSEDEIEIDGDGDDLPESRPGWEVCTDNEDNVHILALISEPAQSIPEAMELGIDLTVGSVQMLDTIARAAATSGMPARVHVEIDTGMARGGVHLKDMPDMARELAFYESSGLIEVVGAWSHLACADEPSSSVTNEQVEYFEQALAILTDAGVHPPMIHLAASSGLLWHPHTRYTAVRLGIMLYGLSPNPRVASAEELGLQPVMRLEAQIASVRDVSAGTGVSYGHTAYTDRDTRLATIPLGYADGIPRSASGRISVWAEGELRPAIGRICMDQFMIDAPKAQVNDTVTLFGAPGSLSADEWAEKAGTIGYEIVSRIGVRVPRIYEE